MVELEHIHGMGYSSDGDKLYFASHDGLRVYVQGQWIQPEGEKHDYMVFSMADDRIYSSSHPSPGSNLAKSWAWSEMNGLKGNAMQWARKKAYFCPRIMEIGLNEDRPKCKSPRFLLPR